MTIKKINHTGKSKGFTLVELLAAMVIITLLSANLLLMLRTGTVIWHSSVTHTGNHQIVRNAYRMIEQEMKNSKAAYVTDNTASQPQAFGFLSAYDRDQNFVTDSTGLPVWQRYTIYYVPTGTRNLVRREVYGSFTEAMTPQQLAAYCDGQGKVIARGINSMTMVLEPVNNWATVNLVCESENPNGKTDRGMVNFSVEMRN